MKKNLLALVLALTFIFPPFAAAQTATKAKSPARKAMDNITAAQMRDYLYFIASDEMEGRDTPSRGLDLTAKFIAMQLSRWGIKPAGDGGTYFQKMTLTRAGADPTKARVEIGGQALTYGTDFLVSPVSSSLTNAPLVFAGNGWYIKSSDTDPLKNIDARGKVVVVYSDQFPRGVNPQQLFTSGRQGVDWADPAAYARQKGAAGLIVVSTPNVYSNWENSRRNRERGSLRVDKLQEAPAAGAAAPIPTVYLSLAAAERLFSGESNDLKTIAANYTSNAPLTAFSLSSGKTVTITTAPKVENLSTQNVVGMIEGSDPALKAEMVAIGAHYDHVGMNPNAPGPDKIWNGADDDGSGTTGVLAIAEALAKSPKKPKRSILFVWHAGEEKGLWGSEYFTKFPTVDLKNVVAQLNIDMIGRSRKPDDTNPRNKDLSGENEIYVIGSKMMSTQLGNVTDSVNKTFLNMSYNFRYDDPKDPNRFFFRSDHFNYAVKGIPIVFWFDGVHEDYHQPGDHPDKIDYQKMEKVTRTIFLTMWELADSKTRPAIDKQLPPELTQR